jgi:protocatechuate 3,4-dioxygenase beta subunit
MKFSLRTLFLLLMIPTLVLAGEISGQLIDLNQQPVSGSTVFLCDQATGIPVDTHTGRPFTEAKRFPPVLTTAVTDNQGQFKFHGISNGTYRLVS